MSVAESHDDIVEEIERRLDSLDAPHGAEDDERWRVDGPGSADWAARKRLKALRQMVQVRAEAKRQREEVMGAVAPFLFPIEQWEKDELERLQHEAGHWEAKLVEYHRDVLAEDPSAKTIRLPHAGLRSRQQPARWEFNDEAFLAWANEGLPAVVRVKFEIDKAEAKAALKECERTEDGAVVLEGGELVPGLLVLPGDVRFTIEQEVSE